ncbi:MAG: ABC transporter ATP-binding protein [Pseudomonadota bacterium]
MSYHAMTEQRSLPELAIYFSRILGPERSFYALAIIYGIAISVLSLAVPVSVQMLVNSIVNTALTTPLVVLSVTLFGLLILSGVLNAMRIHLVDVFGRRFYARMVAEIALRAIYAKNPFFDDDSKGPLFNRYFDIIIVMKRIPYLLVGGFSIILQTLVGCALVSLYHPVFLAFNIVLFATLWLVWAIWGKRAIKSALDLSHKKHASAAWLEGLASSNGFFKTQGHIEEALRQTDHVTAAYMKEHRRHFGLYFAQTLGFLFIYALASASLLGLGGWLVIQGQLSVGQLVAAELVLAAVFFCLSQLGTYLTYFYDLCAAVEELSLFDDIEQESLTGVDDSIDGDASLEFVNARGETRGADLVFDFVVPAGARVLVHPATHTSQRQFTNFMKKHELPDSGLVTIGGNDIAAIKAHVLRQEVIVLDRPNTIVMTIREYLRLCSRDANARQILEVLRAVGLDTTIARLGDGLDTSLAATGWPLSITETMQLKLAAAIIARPRVLVLSQLFDVMPEALLINALDALQKSCGATVICFSNRSSNLGADRFLYLGHTNQRLFEDEQAFRRFEADRRSEQPRLDTIASSPSGNVEAIR